MKKATMTFLVTAEVEHVEGKIETTEAIAEEIRQELEDRGILVGPNSGEYMVTNWYASILDGMDTSHVNRFEVIDHTADKPGRVLVRNSGIRVKLSLQDASRTLKVFLSDVDKGQ